MIVCERKEKFTPLEKKINIHNSDDIRNWCKILGCSKDELREAIDIVGSSVRAVRKYFN